MYAYLYLRAKVPSLYFSFPLREKFRSIFRSTNDEGTSDGNKLTDRAAQEPYYSSDSCPRNFQIIHWADNDQPDCFTEAVEKVSGVHYTEHAEVTKASEN